MTRPRKVRQNRRINDVDYRPLMYAVVIVAVILALWGTL